MPRVRLTAFAAGLLLMSWICPRATAAQADPLPAPRVPVIYGTDLFHPHEDPDDHFDLATLYALPELDVRCIVLDQGERQARHPGRIPVSQLNHLTGRNVPAFAGLGAQLKHPGDGGQDQPAAFQAGVEAILRTLRESDRLATIITVGSLRDVAAAWNREPNLLRARVGRLLVFIGEASRPDFREYNVGLDPAAFIAVMRSDLPVAWVPCFDGGLWHNAGHASFWQARHADLLAAAPPPLVQYFIYALEKETAEPIAFLGQPVNPERRSQLFGQARNLWCAAVFGAVAGRRVIECDGRFTAVLPPASEPHGLQSDHGVFGFREIAIAIGHDAVVRPSESPAARRVWRFEIRDRERYARAMTEATAGLLQAFPITGARK